MDVRRRTHSTYSTDMCSLDMHYAMADLNTHKSQGTIETFPHRHHSRATIWQKEPKHVVWRNRSHQRRPAPRCRQTGMLSGTPVGEQTLYGLSSHPRYRASWMVVQHVQNHDNTQSSQELPCSRPPERLRSA